MEDSLVSEVGFISFVADVADEVGPGDTIGATDQPGVGDGTEGFADVGCVGNVAVGTEKDCAGAGQVGCIAESGICGVLRTEWLLVQFACLGNARVDLRPVI